MYLIIDTETTGLPKRNDSIINDNNIHIWPRIVQFSWQIHDKFGNLVDFKNFIIKPNNFDIPFNAFKIHGITNDIAEKYGHDLSYVLFKFKPILKKYKYIIGHNLIFDLKVIESEFIRHNISFSVKGKKKIDTKIVSTNYCKIPISIERKKFKWPTLSELYNKLFGEKINNIHNSEYDVKATARCFLELLRIGVISSSIVSVNDSKIKDKYTNKIPYSVVDFSKDSLNKRKNLKNIYFKNKNFYKNFFLDEKIKINSSELKKKEYSHIHNHTNFSILNSTININSMVLKAGEMGMKSLGITDYGNMMGAYYFLDAINSFNMKNPKKIIKGIIGCEMFISEYYLQKKFTKEQPDKRWTQVFLSKNKKGYKNLSKLCSHGFLDGLYSGIPRIGKNLIEIYKKNLIALTGDLNSEIPYTILNYGEKEGEKIFLWWKELFGDDFYIELLYHGLEEENYVNNILLNFSKKYNVKYIIQNNVFYLDKKEANAHDILLCIKNREKQSTPIGKEKGSRFGFENQEYYFKNIKEMKKIFQKFPESFDYLNELINKIEPYHISHKVELPKFYSSSSKDIEIEEKNNFLFLKKLTYEGMKKRYKIINSYIKKRIHFELKIIKNCKFSGYFLIVLDFIRQAKKINVLVGPGRGSVAGSIVAYCTGITDIDPIKYRLLFERFLNKNRISLPDIDIDFDDKGRDKIIEWAINMYGKYRVAQIITYSTMGAKLAIRDTARVLGLPIKEAEKISKMIPNFISLKKVLSKEPLFSFRLNKEEKINLEEVRNIFYKKNTLSSEVLKQAKILEGTIRSTGIHACGIIISSHDLRNRVPVSIAKESNLLVTQFDNNVVEHVGLMKIDLLGLKTLTIIKETIFKIKEQNKEYKFSLDDKKTYDLFQKGETIAVFQYESLGMQKYLKKLKPDKFNDIIAMNALYRPGPMQYIPNFISRKHGKEKIIYDIPEMEKFLKETYGITIYQEQVMLLSQKIAGFSKSEADLLRKAMGKKKKNVLDKMKNKFIHQSVSFGYDEKVIRKIWKDWEFFAYYAFNKSHATCYAYIAFQTAYLKTHYPCEYMSSVLSNNMENIKQLYFFIKESKRIGLSIIGPNINKSDSNFKIINKTCILFSLSGIKGLGKNAVNIIIKERKKNGLFLSIFDFIKRIDLRVINKKTLESLILSGSLDDFKIKRDQFFYVEQGENENLIEKIVRFSRLKKKNIVIPNSYIKKWSDIEIMRREKEVLGMYITSNPLDKFFYEKKYFTNTSIKKLKNTSFLLNKIKKYLFIGIITSIEEKIYKRNYIKYCIFSVEDRNDSIELKIYGKKYEKFKSIIKKDNPVLLYISAREKYKNVLHIEKLDNIFEKYINKLIIIINVNQLENEIINKMEKVFSEEKGNKKIDIHIYDEENKKQFIFNSKKYKININSNSLEKLQKIKNINFFLS